MQFLQLRYFQVLAKYQSITRAAAELFISPSSLSQTISRLEDKLGTALFDRVSGRIYLNHRGREFLRYVDQGLSALDSGLSVIGNLGPKADTCVSIATTNASVFNAMMSQFVLKNPHYRLTERYFMVHEFEYNELLRQYDFLLASAPTKKHENLQVHHLTMQPLFWVVLPDNHRLAHQEEVSLAELTGENIVMPRQGFGLYERFMRTFRKAGFEPCIVAECDYTVRIQMVRDGVGITFTSKYSGIADYIGNAVLRSVEGITYARAEAIMWDRRRKLGQAANSFREHAIEWAKSRWS